MDNQLPRLYSFRRCPYAIRARLALKFADILLETIEVALNNKPQALLEISPKGTVPVLQLHSGLILDESLDIIRWAFGQMSVSNSTLITVESPEMTALMDANDQGFKHWLDRYKYYDRYPEQSKALYQSQVLTVLQSLDARLCQNAFLCTASPSIADIAIFPFVRQCASVDLVWFDSLQLPALQQWRLYWLQHPLFVEVMQKHPGA